MRVRVLPSHFGIWLGIAVFMVGSFFLLSGSSTTVRAASNSSQLYWGVAADNVALTPSNLRAVEASTRSKPDFWVRSLNQLDSREVQTALTNNVKLMLTWSPTSSTDTQQAGIDQAKAAMQRFSYFGNPNSRQTGIFLADGSSTPHSSAFLSGWDKGISGSNTLLRAGFYSSTPASSGLTPLESSYCALVRDGSQIEKRSLWFFRLPAGQTQSAPLKKIDSSCASRNGGASEITAGIEAPSNTLDAEGQDAGWSPAYLRANLPLLYSPNQAILQALNRLTAGEVAPGAVALQPTAPAVAPTVAPTTVQAPATTVPTTAIPGTAIPGSTVPGATVPGAAGLAPQQPGVVSQAPATTVPAPVPGAVGQLPQQPAIAPSPVAPAIGQEPTTTVPGTTIPGADPTQGISTIANPGVDPSGVIADPDPTGSAATPLTATPIAPADMPGAIVEPGSLTPKCEGGQWIIRSLLGMPPGATTAPQQGIPSTGSTGISQTGVPSSTGISQQAIPPATGSTGVSPTGLSPAGLSPEGTPIGDPSTGIAQPVASPANVQAARLDADDTCSSLDTPVSETGNQNGASPAGSNGPPGQDQTTPNNNPSTPGTSPNSSGPTPGTTLPGAPAPGAKDPASTGLGPKDGPTMGPTKDGPTKGSKDKTPNAIQSPTPAATPGQQQQDPTANTQTPTTTPTPAPTATPAPAATPAPGTTPSSGLPPVTATPPPDQGKGSLANTGTPIWPAIIGLLMVLAGIGVIGAAAFHKREKAW